MILIEKNTNKYKKIIFVSPLQKAENLIFDKDNEGNDLETYLNLPKFLGKLNIDFEAVESEENIESKIYDSQTQTFVDINSVQFEIDSDRLKSDLIAKYSKTSFEKRNILIKDYQLINLAVGELYDDFTIEEALATVQSFKTEYYRLKELVNNATSQHDIDNIVENWPTAIVTI